MAKQALYNPDEAEYLNPAIDRRVVFITGANSGIGYYTALHLYLHGYIIYIGGRNEDKVIKAITDIELEAKSRIASQPPSNKHVGELHYIHLDLLDLSSVIEAANEFSKRESKLNILINNAGIMALPYEISKDGYEIQYQANFVSHFLLTFKLLPNLKNVSKEGNYQPRVIHLSSMGHMIPYKYFDPSDKVNKFPNAYFTWVRYGNAKLAAIQFMKRFAKEYPDILALSAHPGVIVDTELYNHWKTLPLVGYPMRAFLNLTHQVMGVTLEEGSFATLKAALDPSLVADKDGGKYYVTGGVETEPSKLATNKEYINRTWDWNMKELEEKGYIKHEEIL